MLVHEGFFNLSMMRGEIISFKSRSLAFELVHLAFN
jgi:hypothetical protein